MTTISIILLSNKLYFQNNQFQFFCKENSLPDMEIYSNKKLLIVPLQEPQWSKIYAVHFKTFELDFKNFGTTLKVSNLDIWRENSQISKKCIERQKFLFRSLLLHFSCYSLPPRVTPLNICNAKIFIVIKKIKIYKLKYNN